MSRCVLLLLLALMGCRRGAAVAPSGDAGVPQLWDRQVHRFAVVIGNNAAGPQRKPLRYAEHDAGRLAGVLRELGSFRGSDLMLLQGQGPTQVRSALTRMRTLVTASQRERPGTRALALVYYSGHSNGRTLELGRDRMELQEVQQALVDTGADLRVMILDACQSGQLLAAKGGNPGPTFELETGGAPGTGEAFLTSAAPSEEALESSELQGSFFSHHLLSGLRGAADANRDGRVNLSEAYQYASARTVAETTATIYGPQHPSYRLRLAGQGDLALTELPASRASIEVMGDLDRVLFIDALGGNVTGEWAGGTARRLGLTPGPYLVKAWKDRRIYRGRLTLGLGENRKLTVDMLDDATAPPPAPAATIPPSAPEPLIQRTLAGDQECRHRCVFDPRSERSNCNGPFSVVSSEPPRGVASIEMPSRRGLLRVRFEVCNPKGLYLHIADSPSCDGGGGDATQFSNDAELELQNAGLWLFGNDYGRTADKLSPVLAGKVDYVATGGCSVRTLLIADGGVRAAEPPLNVRSPFALRLDPPADHEGSPDRIWYVGLNRSVGSNEPKRSGSGLSWVDLCIVK
jgi:hypothetical protein